MTTTTIKLKTPVDLPTANEYAAYIQANPSEFIELELVDIIDGEPVVTNIIHADDAIEYLLIWC